MIRFLAVRVAQAAIVLLVVSFAVYMLIGLMPGDPVDAMIMANPHATPADAARLKALYGLDKPLLERYASWLGAALHGDLGYSRLTHHRVLEDLLPRIGNTALLVTIVVPLCVMLGLPLGIAAARRPGSMADTAINLLCFSGISMPPFWLGLLLILLFSVTLGWLPAGGMGPPGDHVSPGQRIPYLIMPVVTLVALNFGVYTRHVRAAMIDNLQQDYIRTARAKGVSERGILWRHALRNALTPLVTVTALDLGSLFSGALVTETVFGYLGMGKLIYDSIMGNDYNLALVALLFACAMIILANLAADIAYAALDPRVKYGA
jgi:peptide/nickel transport system permease protein